MKLRFEVDQAECFRRGIDCPKSIVSVEVDPAKVNPEIRELIAQRLDGIDVLQIHVRGGEYRKFAPYKDQGLEDIAAEIDDESVGRALLRSDLDWPHLGKLFKMPERRVVAKGTGWDDLVTAVKANEEDVQKRVSRLKSAMADFEAASAKKVSKKAGAK